MLLKPAASCYDFPVEMQFVHIAGKDNRKNKKDYSNEAYAEVLDILSGDWNQLGNFFHLPGPTLIVSAKVSRASFLAGSILLVETVTSENMGEAFSFIT